MKPARFTHAIAVALVAFASASTFASDVGNYPPVPPPDSLYPFNQPPTAVQRDATARPQPAAPTSRDDPSARTVRDSSTDRVTGVVTAPGYTGPRAATGQ